MSYPNRTCQLTINCGRSMFTERSARKSVRLLTTSAAAEKSPETVLLKQLKATIRLKGPITVADYMREVLTNSFSGYYMHKDVFGRSGDFTTSPEISQMFGELVGIWCVNEWMRCGSPNKLNVVELGPGRGTLADDMLRVFSKFPDLHKAVSLHLVEVSPELSRMQRNKLTGRKASADEKELEDRMPSDNSSHHYSSCVSQQGVDVRWYKQLSDVPHGPMFLVAHEFLDALPIHKFQKQGGKWHEVLIDIDDRSDSKDHLQFVLSPGSTTASSLLLKDLICDPRDHVELCPKAAVIVSEIAERIEKDGGFGLLVDYGHSGEKTDTFRAFKKHTLHDPLSEPGMADLTADVNFSYLQKNISSQVSTFGPITQEKFLHNMGIGVRLQVLLSSASTEQRKSLITGYDMLTNPAKMGERFKFFAILEKLNDDYFPAGFAALQ